MHYLAVRRRISSVSSSNADTTNTDVWIEVYHKVAYIFVVFLLVLANVSYMYGRILITLGKRKRNSNIQMSAEFKNHIEQVSFMVIVNGCVYFC